MRVAVVDDIGTNDDPRWTEWPGKVPDASWRRAPAWDDPSLRAKDDVERLAAFVALEAKMSDLSEECWSAGWVIGLDASLWDAVANPQGAPWGMGEVSPGDVAVVRRLASTAGGWVAWLGLIGPESGTYGVPWVDEVTPGG